MVGAIEDAGPYVEFPAETSDCYPWQVGLFTPVLEARDGKVQIPDAPRWGVETFLAWLEAADHHFSELG